MNSESKQFLKDFLGSCAPSGFEENAQKVWVDIIPRRCFISER